MSYPKDLEEYTDEELQLELQRRHALRLREGKCSYCRQPLDTPQKKSRNPCRHHEMIEMLPDGGVRVSASRFAHDARA